MRPRIAQAARALMGDPAAASYAALSDMILWLPVGLTLGVLAWFTRAQDPGAGLLALALVTLALGGGVLRLCPGALWFPALFTMSIAAGFLLTELRADRLAAPILPYRYYGPIEGRIVEVDRSSSDRMRLTLDRVRLGDMEARRVPQRVRVSLHAEPAHLVPAPGMQVMLTGHLMPPPPPASPMAFDFRRHAWFERLGAVGYARLPVMLAVDAAQGPGRGLLAERLRARLAAAITRAVPGQPGAMIAAMTSGDRSALSQETNRILRETNLYHVVAISGLHMGLLVGIVFWSVRLALACWAHAALHWPIRKIAALAALVVASFYLWLSGFQVSTQRAHVMACVMLLAIVLERRAISLNNLAIAASLIVILTPEAAMGAGFQMSFAASAALVIVFSRWSGIDRQLRRRRFGRAASFVAGTLLAPLVAGLATAPITAAQFHRLSDYGLVANVLAVPVLGSVVMPAAVLAAVLAPLGLAGPALWVAGQGAAWMLWVAEVVAGWEGAVRAVAQPPAQALPLILYGACVLALAPGGLFARGRLAGLALICAGGWFWGTARPPALLIAPEAEQVGLLTPGGRVLSKDGAGFVAQVWLEADGDLAEVSEAAAREGFSGPQGLRLADWAGRPVHHLSGRNALGHLPELCHAGAIIVLQARAPQGDWRGCTLWDQDRLRETGAVAYAADGRVITTKGVKGNRRWSAP